MKKGNWKNWLSNWSRWLHIYLSMFSFVIVLFFSITGLTLNHLDWFPEKEILKEQKGQLNPIWVNVADTSQIKKLEIVEHFRNQYAVKGLINDFRIDENEVSISFQGPGYTADAFIQREDGKFQLSTRELGWVAFFNDLHKGRDTGKSWSWVIDFSAIFMTIISLTGLILLLFLKKKRFNGIIWLILGLGAVGLLYYL
ncbi:MAG: PepSY-associated TM helix domain-containing protein [Aquirufa sp.]